MLVSCCLLSLNSQLMVAGPGGAASHCTHRDWPLLTAAGLPELVAIDQVTHKHSRSSTSAQPRISHNLIKKTGGGL